MNAISRDNGPPLGPHAVPDDVAPLGLETLGEKEPMTRAPLLGAYAPSFTISPRWGFSDTLGELVHATGSSPVRGGVVKSPPVSTAQPSPRSVSVPKGRHDQTLNQALHRPLGTRGEQ